jgi:hypothetical protein
MKQWTQQDEEALQALQARKKQHIDRFDEDLDALVSRKFAAGTHPHDVITEFLFEHAQATLDTLAHYYEVSPVAVPAEPEYGKNESRVIPGEAFPNDRMIAKR